MIYLKLKEQDGKYSVLLIHYKPFDLKHGLNKTEEELLKDGVLVESLPVAEARQGKQAVLYAKKDTKELYYEYVDFVETESEIAQLKTQNEELAMATVELADIAATQNAQLQEQGEALIDLANTLVEVMG